MTIKSQKGQNYRYTPAFILLFLAKENLYGAILLNKLESELPYYPHRDSAVIYRSLQELEKDKLVTSYWETDTSGPARKWYKITTKGLEKLGEFKEDMESRKKNLEYFIDSYERLSISDPIDQ